MDPDSDELKVPLTGGSVALTSSREGALSSSGLAVFIVCFAFRALDLDLLSASLCAVAVIALLTPMRHSSTAGFAVGVLNFLPLLGQLLLEVPSLRSLVSAEVVSYFGLNLSISSSIAGVAPLLVFSLASAASGGSRLTVLSKTLRMHSSPIAVFLLLSVAAVKTNVWASVYAALALLVLLGRSVTAGTISGSLSMAAINGLAIFACLSIIAQLCARVWLPPWLTAYPRHLGDRTDLQVFWGFDAGSELSRAQVLGEFLLVLALTGMSREASDARPHDADLRKAALALWVTVLVISLLLTQTSEISLDTLVLILSTTGIMYTGKRALLFFIMVIYLVWSLVNILVRIDFPEARDHIASNRVAESIGLGDPHMTWTVGILAGLSVILFSTEHPDESHWNRLRAGRFLYELKCKLFMTRRRRDAVGEAMSRKLARVTAKWTSNVPSTSDDSELSKIEQLCQEGHSQWEAERALILTNGDSAKAIEVLELMRNFSLGQMSSEDLRKRVAGVTAEPDDILVTPVDSEEEDDQERLRTLAPRKTVPSVSVLESLRPSAREASHEIHSWLDQNIQDELYISSEGEDLYKHRENDNLVSKLVKLFESFGEGWMMALAFIGFTLSRCALRIPVIILSSLSYVKAFPAPVKILHAAVLSYSFGLLIIRVVGQMLVLTGWLGQLSASPDHELVEKILDKVVGVKTHSSNLLFFLSADLFMVLAALFRREALVRIGLWDHIKNGNLVKTRGDSQLSPPAEEFRSSDDVRASSSNRGDLEALVQHYRKLRVEAQMEVTDLAKAHPAGRDLHILQFVISLALWVFVLFFYRFMTEAKRNFSQQNGHEYSVLDDFKSGELSKGMSALLVFHAFCMVTDRVQFIAASQVGREKRTRKFHQIPIIFRFGVFFYLQTLVLLAPTLRPAAAAHYLLFTLYLAVSLLQIRDGNPLSALDTMRPSIQYINWKERFHIMLFYAYRAAPFLHEMRTFLDWSVKRTCLDQREYFTVQDCHNVLFLGQYRRARKKYSWPGQPVPLIWDKLLFGWLLSFVLLVVLFGPLFIFSNAVTKDVDAPLVDMQMSVHLFVDICKAGDKRECEDITVRLWKGNESHVKRFIDDKKDKKHTISYNTQSESALDVNRFESTAKKVEDSIADPNAQVTMGIQIIYKYSREIVVSDQFERIDDRAEYFICAKDKLLPSLDKDQQHDCDGETLAWAHIKSLVDGLKLPGTEAPVMIPQSIPTDWTFLRSGTELPGKGRHDLKFSRVPDGAKIFIKITPVQGTTEFDEISTELRVQPLQSESVFVKIGLIGMYASVVYAIGRIIKTSYSGQTYTAIYDDMGNPDELIDVVNSISIAQHQCDLKREYMLYKSLSRLLKSPESLARMEQPMEEYGIGQTTKPPYPDLLPDYMSSRVAKINNK